MAAEPSLSPIQVLATLEGNSTCIDCRAPEVAYFVPDFGVFACRNCAQVISTHQVSVKSLSHEIFTDLEVEAGKQGGNGVYRAYIEEKGVVDKYTGDWAREYKERLQAAIRGQTLLSDQVSGTVGGVLSWLESKFTPLVDGLNEKLSSNATLGKVGNFIERGFNAYDARVERHIVQEDGVLHPLKRHADNVAKVFQSSGADYRPLEAAPSKPSEATEEIETITH